MYEAHEGWSERSSASISVCPVLHPVSMCSPQADYEQELAVQKAAHRRELARSKDDLLNLLAVAEAKTIHIDENTIRKKYTKEIERITVRVTCQLFAL